jgi:hypothetical protein
LLCRSLQVQVKAVNISLKSTRELRKFISQCFITQLKLRCDLCIQSDELSNTFAQLRL